MWVYQLIISIVPISISIYVILLGQISKRRESIPIIRLQYRIFGYRPIDPSTEKQEFSLSLENISSSPALNCSLAISYDLSYLHSQGLLHEIKGKSYIKEPIVDLSADNQGRRGLYSPGFTIAEFDSKPKMGKIHEIAPNAFSNHEIRDVSEISLLINTLIFGFRAENMEKPIDCKIFFTISFEDIYGRHYLYKFSLSIHLRDLIHSTQTGEEKENTYLGYNGMKLDQPEKRMVVTGGKLNVIENQPCEADDLSSIKHPVKSFFKAYTEQ
ncbi:hypothetical protein AO468_06345 [Oenococcus oeni]|uniref:hypothetical protein n=1 Tax=Oenococcus oeni TaxID=1247 RepID=UPI0008F89584|nr:hypothetical protein [Oenococcus oeni]OIK96872.1 hypothetical protein ATW86_09995 [Oenococcus oeni]PDH93241.1 hypothetical protein AO468_06345 [Oenococcus oeni]